MEEPNKFWGWWHAYSLWSALITQKIYKRILMKISGNMQKKFLGTSDEILVVMECLQFMGHFGCGLYSSANFLAKTYR